MVFCVGLLFSGIFFFTHFFFFLEIITPELLWEKPEIKTPLRRKIKPPSPAAKKTRNGKRPREGGKGKKTPQNDNPLFPGRLAELHNRMRGPTGFPEGKGGQGEAKQKNEG
eukprot:FR736439.1.p2 GENE.FR736439.1~~FR736439.1.p2  ORF type:complete len:111 (-),score=44.22 FR736439.1:951-1283(-)